MIRVFYAARGITLLDRSIQLILSPELIERFDQTMREAAAKNRLGFKAPVYASACDFLPKLRGKLQPALGPQRIAPAIETQRRDVALPQLAVIAHLADDIGRPRVIQPK